MSSIQTIGKYNFGSKTSEIGIKLGRVYIYCENDYTDRTWYLPSNAEESINWIERYSDKSDTEKMSKQMGDYYLDSLLVMRIDWLLKRLLGLSLETDSKTYKHAVENNEAARKWAKDLKIAQEKLKDWFGRGCPMPQEELNTILRWSKENNSSTDKGFAELCLSSHILSTIRTAQEKQIQNARN